MTNNAVTTTGVVQPESPWRKKAEMAEHYRCDIKTITNLMRRRILPFVKIGRFVRFDLRECERAMGLYKRPSRLLAGSAPRFTVLHGSASEPEHRTLTQPVEAAQPTAG